MSDEFIRRLGRPMRPDVVRARDELPVDWSDASCDQVGVLKIANPYRTIIAFRDEIDEAITVARVDLELGVAPRHFREDGSEARRTERKWHGNSQAAAKVADASGGISKESHEVTIQRMIAAGANMMTVMALAGEWQRDWARTEHVEELTEILIQHFGGSGIAFLWEQQLLNTPVPSNAG
ncbi:hypothetical protein J2T08_006255 [Neorhizobium galegae]|nr:hypothetical protein [Neorhizobium galegae]